MKPFSPMFWFFIAALAAAIPIPLIKYYTINKQMMYLYLATSSYYVLVYAYIQLLQSKDMTVIYPIVKVISILLVFIYGVAFLKTPIHHETVLGLLMAIGSLYLLSRHT